MNTKFNAFYTRNIVHIILWFHFCLTLLTISLLCVQIAIFAWYTFTQYITRNTFFSNFALRLDRVKSPFTTPTYYRLSPTKNTKQSINVSVTSINIISKYIINILDLTVTTNVSNEFCFYSMFLNAFCISPLGFAHKTQYRWWAVWPRSAMHRSCLLQNFRRNLQITEGLALSPSVVGRKEIPSSNNLMTLIFFIKG